ncbi:TlpA family protein disulfide reductase [Labilibacter marinus]|uniref:TlpA family protein disulfide reductase n=1 Tax=Labilibacter marinus TaxID=1477105 RepID=UPI00082FB8DE|nr:TlpA disulfide reductase family protein [Labilibacter marinus]
MKKVDLKRATVVLGFIVCLAISAHAQNNGKVGLEIGNKAPEIKMLSPQGDVISLSSLKGQLVLIDFWASWCGPCRKENPHVVEAYEDYKDRKFSNAKGFTILSVSLDSNKKSWEKAIKADELVWPNHVSDLKGWKSKAAEIYRVRGIPDNYLVDGDGIIVAKGLRGPYLEAALKKLAKKK